MRLFGFSRARGRRPVPRAHIPVQTLICTSTRDHAAELVHLSRTGARLRGVCYLAKGEQVTFRAEDVRASGEIVWVADRQCGVEFNTPIAADEVDRIRSFVSS